MGVLDVDTIPLGLPGWLRCSLLVFLPGVLSSSCLLWHLRLRLHSRM